MPVPIAVAPMLISRMSDDVSRRRSMSSPIVTPYAWNSWPSVIGTASCSCVRPIFTMSANSSPFSRNASRSSARALSRSRSAQMAAMRIAVGYTSLVDCERLTWLFGVHGVVFAAAATEQLERAVRDDFVRVHVRRRACAALDHIDHELVVQVAGADLLGSAHDRVGNAPGRAGRARGWRSAAASFTAASALIRCGYCAIGMPVIGKFSTARSVWMP